VGGGMTTDREHQNCISGVGLNPFSEYSASSSGKVRGDAAFWGSGESAEWDSRMPVAL